MPPFGHLRTQLHGELYFDDSTEHLALRKVYATDASVYQEFPAAVCLPTDTEDLVTLVRFATRHGLTLIPRGAGTSLAGQVVGNGIVVDLSKYFTAILELNEKEQWVRIQPGVIRDDLNAFLKPYGLMFGPETSTANRAVIGGMIGNNSCGLHSIVWGDTRKNLVAVKAILYDGSEVVFEEINKEKIDGKIKGDDAEAVIYRSVINLLSDTDNRNAIKNGFPKASIQRRNTGYALDSLLQQTEEGSSFNIAKLIAGSEGTLCFITEATLQLQPLPPRERCMVAVHTNSIRKALEANIIALQHACTASELVDDIILNYTKTNIDQSKNRFFVQGEPKAILMVEFFDQSTEQLNARAQAFIAQLKQADLAYAWPVLFGMDTDKAWNLRKAGLGLLRNEPGDTQPVNLIEDCAVDPVDLPDYIDEVEALLKKYALKYSMYAHAGAGELHVEPMINLKTQAGKHLFRTVLAGTAAIVKKYNGSLSGEHGDGRLRGEFIPFMMGEKNYALFEQVKNIFDPQHVFNRGKIVNTPPMNAFLRCQQDEQQKEIKTVFDFSGQESILRLAEKCSGSGDCRKTHVSGGTMCPSFMATRSERDTTRARANVLRHFYTYGNDKKTTATETEVRDILDLCLSCKACKSECPSSVDIAKMKAEFTQAYYDKHGIPFRSKLIADYSRQMKLASRFSKIYNAMFGTTRVRKMLNSLVGFHPNRSMPLLHDTTLRKWFDQRSDVAATGSGKRVLLFCDEFTNYNDVELGKKTVLLLEALGFTVEMPVLAESGRTWLSKGLVKKAKEIAINNVQTLRELVDEQTPIIGIEPSAILTLRDEYKELVPPGLRPAATHIAQNVFLFEEWFARELSAGRINKNQFGSAKKAVLVHGHCHQKALSSTDYIKQSLSVLPGCTVQEIPSGCCGMAGSFGYEKEHYKISMSIGELVLFPAIKKAAGAVIAASGTSCRHQIKDATGVIARHTAEILYDALNTA